MKATIPIENAIFLFRSAMFQMDQCRAKNDTFIHTIESILSKFKLFAHTKWHETQVYQQEMHILDLI